MTEKNPPHQSLKEYWADPKRNRRRETGGRRESDFAVCPWHEDHMEQQDKTNSHICGKIKELKEARERNFAAFKVEHDSDISNLHRRVDELLDKIIGKQTFAIFVGIFLSVITLFSILNYNMFDAIKNDLKSHIEEVKKQ